MRRIAILALLILARGNISLACSCVPSPTIAEAFAEADLVFIGRCSSGQLVMKHDPEGFDHYAAKYTFEVQESFKGMGDRKTLVVDTGIGFGDCGNEFRLGMSCLIYAYKNETVFETSICSRTAFVGVFPDGIQLKARDEVETLRKTKK